MLGEVAAAGMSVLERAEWWKAVVDVACVAVGWVERYSLDSVARWSRPACAARAGAGRMNVSEAARNPSWMGPGRVGLCMSVM